MLALPEMGVVFMLVEKIRLGTLEKVTAEMSLKVVLMVNFYNVPQ